MILPLVLFLAAAPALDPLAPPARTPPIGHWTFDEGTGAIARDASGNGLDGRIVGATHAARGAGFALEFDGKGQYVELPPSPRLRLAGDMTILACVRADDRTGRDQLIVGDTAGLGVCRNFNLRTGQDGTLQFEAGDDGECTTLAETPHPALTGAWQKIALVVDGPSTHLYVDGREVHAEEMAAPLRAIPGAPRRIGGWDAGWFKGGIDEVRIYNRALEEHEIREWSGQPAPHEPRPSITLHPRAFLAEDRLEVALDARGALTPDLRARATITHATGGAPPRTSDPVPLTLRRPGASRATVSIPLTLEGVPPGPCDIGAELVDPQGRVAAAGRTRWTRPPPPPPEDAAVGMSDAVPAPWTPLEVRTAADGSVTVACWGRSHQFTGAPFPSQIETRGAPLLAAPMRLAAATGGDALAWDAGPIRVEARAAGRIALEQSSTAGPLALSTNIVIEYDGFLRTDWVVSARDPCRLDTLTLEIPFRPERALYQWCFQLMHRPDLSPRPGALPAAGLRTRFLPIVWVGDDERGLSWFAESDRHWTDGDTPGAIELVPGPGRVVLRLRMVRSPVDLRRDTPLRFSFGFQATPVKAMGATCWDHRFASCPTYGRDFGMFAPEPRGGGTDTPGDAVARAGARTLLLLNWTSWFGYPAPTPDRADATRRFVRDAHARGLRVLPYCGFMLPVQAPEHAAWGEEFIRQPRMRRVFAYPGEVGSPTDWVCLASRWQDFLVAKFDRAMGEFDFDGVYLDTTIMPLACRNARHGCGHVRDGAPRSTHPIFATRTALQRLYTALRARKPGALLDAHVYDCMNSSALAFATSYWNGEQLPNARDGFLLDVLPLDRFRAEFMGHQWGVPAELLHYRLGDYRPCLGLALLHDVMTRAHASLDDLALNARVWRAADAFGRADAEWFPYWRNADRVAVAPAGASASLYRHPTGRLLLVVNNTTRTHADVIVRLDSARLGLQGRALAATDALSGAPVPLDGIAITRPLDPMAWALVRIDPRPASP